jgi:hypothetical protein
MNCAAALEAMLDAEPSDLAGEGTTSLAAHLAACQQCRGVAHRISMDTRLLAVSIVPLEARARMRRPAPVWVRWSPVPVGLVAALLLVVALRTPDVPPNVTVGDASSTPEVVVPAPVASPRVVTNAVPVKVQRTEPTRVRAYPAPIPVAAVRINPPPQTFAVPGADPGPAVIVNPPAGQRVAVMRTSNPKLTVVWLY